MDQSREPLTRDHIRSLVVGPVIDELMATHVMGWHKASFGVQDPDPNLDYWTDDTNKVLVWCALWRPSVNIAQVWQAIEKLQTFELEMDYPGSWIAKVFLAGNGWTQTATAKTAPLAICRVLLLAKVT